MTKVPALCRWMILLSILIVPLWATLSDYGITWDEPIYMEAAWNIKEWLSLETEKRLNPAAIDHHWKTDPARNIHPSGVKWLYLLAQEVIFWENDAYRQNGIFNILLFSTCLFIFLNWWGKDLFWRQLIYVILLLTIPRFFAHIYFPATDIPMVSFLLLFLVVLDWALFRKMFWVAGLLMGFLISIKFTSLLLIFPIFLFLIIWHRTNFKKVLIRLSFICLVGLLFFYILNPDYWFSPLSRSTEFLRQTLTRKDWAPILLFFNGHFYSYRGPFHYPFTMFSITTPLLHIASLLLGITVVILNGTIKNDKKIMLLFICFIFPFIMLALPISPANDGLRYLLPAFPFALCFMTIGLEKLWNFVRDQTNNSPLMLSMRLGSAIIALTLFAFDIKGPARFPPFELTYYNKIVGGTPGAYRRGFETTYWWEIMNSDVIERLNYLCGHSYVYFPISPTDLYFKHMIDSGRINFRPAPALDKADFMLIYGRPFVGFWEYQTRSARDKLHLKAYRIWEISLDSVPLLRLYSLQPSPSKEKDNKNE